MKNTNSFKYSGLKSFPNNTKQVFKHAYHNAIKEYHDKDKLRNKSTQVAWDIVKKYYSRNLDILVK